MKGLAALRLIVEIQSRDGNWNYDEYMFGMANGLILALATMEDKEPKFLERPKKFIYEDKPKVPPEEESENHTLSNE